MVFSSLTFLCVFLPVILILDRVLPGVKTKNVLLLLASIIFYAYGEPFCVFIMLGSCILNYVWAMLIGACQNKGKTGLSKLVVAVAVIQNLAVLGIYKYSDFAISTVNGIAGLSIKPTGIVMPIGISFFTFQAMSYVIDVYRKDCKVQKNPFNVMLYVSFFPQLVAGPIERSENLISQIKNIENVDLKNWQRIRKGVYTMLWGYFLKLVIADRCAILVDTVYNNVSAYFGYQIIVASILFALQIYCDFMSYSTIAKGAARVLGYELMENFDLPYFATSIKDFWRRWHISLSSWLRDYLYIPLGGNRKGRIRKYINIIITFFVSGLWHGAAFTFIIWGLLHGIYQIIEDLLKPYTDKLLAKTKLNPKNAALMVLKIIVTFILVDIAWVFFRANSFGEAKAAFRNAMQLGGLPPIKEGLLNLGLDQRNWIMLGLGLAILFVSSVMRANKVGKVAATVVNADGKVTTADTADVTSSAAESGRDTVELSKQGALVNWISARFFIIRYALYWGCLIMIIFSMDITGQEFIYFQF